MAARGRRSRASRSAASGPLGHPLVTAYHDDEWGAPQRDPRTLFEFLILEGAQAGLSWRTILNKREGYRAAFAGFDPVAVAAFDERDVERLLADPGIVRNRAKISAHHRQRPGLDRARRPVEFLWELRRRPSDPGRATAHWASCRPPPTSPIG